VKRRKSRSLKEDLNVTNLVDVTFAILVVFMITAPLMSRGVQVDLPKTSSPPIEDKKIIRVSIDPSGQIFIDKESVELRELGGVLKSTWDGESPVAVNSDSTVAYGKVMKVVSVIQKTGVKKVGFLTQLDSKGQ
jgi:biopolymer transport protein TolR